MRKHSAGYCALAERVSLRCGTPRRDQDMRRGEILETSRLEGRDGSLKGHSTQGEHLTDGLVAFHAVDGGAGVVADFEDHVGMAGVIDARPGRAAEGLQRGLEL